VLCWLRRITVIVIYIGPFGSLEAGSCYAGYEELQSSLFTMEPSGCRVGYRLWKLSYLHSLILAGVHSSQRINYLLLFRYFVSKQESNCYEKTIVSYLYAQGILIYAYGIFIEPVTMECFIN